MRWGLFTSSEITRLYRSRQQNLLQFVTDSNDTTVVITFCDNIYFIGNGIISVGVTLESSIRAVSKDSFSWIFTLRLKVVGSIVRSNQRGVEVEEHWKKSSLEGSNLGPVTKIPIAET